VGLPERDVECHRHLHDMLSTLADAGTRPGDAPPRLGDVHDVYKHRCDAH
jgi:hypothetical protein